MRLEKEGRYRHSVNQFKLSIKLRHLVACKLCISNVLFVYVRIYSLFELVDSSKFHGRGSLISFSMPRAILTALARRQPTSICPKSLVYIIQGPII